MKDIFRQIKWGELDIDPIRHLIDLARSEDLSGSGMARKFPYSEDLTTSAMLDGAIRGSADLMARKHMVVCGIRLVPLILEAYGGECHFERTAEDGDRLKTGDCIGTLIGDVAQMLQAERIILNFLQYLSGISTLTSSYVQALGQTKTRVLDTRKTTPGYRVLEKYAVSCGGGWNHRMGLYHWILVKDNHLSSTGSSHGEALEHKVARAKAKFPDVIVEVEVDEMNQIEPVLLAGADVIMLDNFDNTSLFEAVRFIDGRAVTEASGGVELGRIRSIAETGVDFVSSGALIHQSQWIDIGLDWQN